MSKKKIIGKNIPQARNPETASFLTISSKIIFFRPNPNLLSVVTRKVLALKRRKKVISMFTVEKKAKKKKLTSLALFFHQMTSWLPTFFLYLVRKKNSIKK